MWLPFLNWFVEIRSVQSFWWRRLNEAPAEHHRRIVYRLTLGLIVSTVAFAGCGKSDIVAVRRPIVPV
jgi:hypothetical protein